MSKDFCPKKGLLSVRNITDMRSILDHLLFTDLDRESIPNNSTSVANKFRCIAFWLQRFSGEKVDYCDWEVTLVWFSRSLYFFTAHRGRR